MSRAGEHPSPTVDVKSTRAMAMPLSPPARLSRLVEIPHSETEAALHLHDREPLWLFISHCHRVAAVHLALNAEARCLQEALHRWIERSSMPRSCIALQYGPAASAYPIAIGVPTALHALLAMVNAPDTLGSHAAANRRELRSHGGNEAERQGRGPASPTRGRRRQGNRPACYAGDLELPGMLFGRCLRSPHASARIVSIDVRRAKALPGVHAVLTGADVPDTRYGRMCKDIPLLAKGVTRFVGEKVAAVAADTVEIAEAALELMDVEYAELPAIFSPQDAMRPTAPVIHPEAVEILPGAATRSHGELSMYPPIPNVISQFTVRHGDVARAFATAHRIFEHHFAVPRCIRAISSRIPASSRSARTGSSMCGSQIKARISRVLIWQGLSACRRIVFGSILSRSAAILAARDRLWTRSFATARSATGRPVKMVMNSFEELTAGNPRHSASITLRTGVFSDAKLLAIEARVIFNAGAYAGFVPVPTLHGGYSELAGTYRVPNCAIEVLRVYTNTVPCGHMRAPGAPQVAFAVDIHIDMVAHEMGLDPLEMRQRNAIVDGDLTPLGETRRHLRCRETIDAGARAFGWDKPKPPHIGREASRSMSIRPAISGTQR